MHAVSTAEGAGACLHTDSGSHAAEQDCEPVCRTAESSAAAAPSSSTQEPAVGPALQSAASPADPAIVPTSSAADSHTAAAGAVAAGSVQPTTSAPAPATTPTAELPVAAAAATSALPSTSQGPQHSGLIQTMSVGSSFKKANSSTRHRARVTEAPAAVFPSPSESSQHWQPAQPLLQAPQQQQQQPCVPAATATCTAAAIVASDPMQSSAGAATAAAAVSVAAAGSVVDTGSVLAPAYQRTASSSILSLHVHGTSQLLPDLLLTDPVVRLHVVHSATGEYVRILHELTGDVQQQQRQLLQQQTDAQGRSVMPAASGTPQQGQGKDSNGDAARSTGCVPLTRHLVHNSLQAELLEFPGRPALSTLDNNTPQPKPALLEYVPPLQTRPFDLTSSSNSGSGGICSSAGSTSGCLAAFWDEKLDVDLAPEAFMDGDAVLLLELLQLPAGFTRFKRHASDFGQAGTGHAVAWAFLDLSGLKHQHQQQQLGQQPVKLRLQMYHYAKGSLDSAGLLSPRLAGSHPATSAKAAYLSFKKLSLFVQQAGMQLSAAKAAITLDATGGTSCAADGSNNVAAAPADTGSSPMNSNWSAVAMSSNNGSPWKPGLWSPRAASPGFTTSAGVLLNPTLSLQSPIQGFGRAADVKKYPGFIEVSVSTMQRPAAAVVVTDPAAGMRPELPAGYGSGFEIGRMPVSLLHMPRAAAHAAAAAMSARLSSTNDSGADSGNVPDEQQLLLEGRLHRPHTQPCQVPNALLVDIKGTPGGCSCISISRDGRWLAAACADASDKFQIVLYHGLTGKLRWVLGAHDGMVYSIAWARDDSAIVTASADFTAKVWHLPELPSLSGTSGWGLRSNRSICQRWGSNTAPSEANNMALQQLAAGFLPTTAADAIQDASLFSSSASRPLGMHSSGVAAAASLGVSLVSTSSAAAAAAAAAAGVSTCVLQHTCYVYAAELHPMTHPLLAVVTVAFDGVVRLWSAAGVVLYCLKVSDVPINCLAIDHLGTRVFVGDAAGILTELSLDLTPLTFGATAAAASASGASHLGYPNCSAAGGSPSCGWYRGHSGSGGLSSPGGGVMGGSSGSGGQAGGGMSTSGSAAVVEGGRDDALGLPAASSVLHYGGAVSESLAGQPLLKNLRSSQELSGCPLLSLACHPGGHHLVALARSPKGSSELVAMDVKLLLVARSFAGVHCSTAPLKFGISPDGRYILSGSEDGSATIWDFATGTATPLPHMALGGAPIYCMAWSSCFHTVTVCSFSHYAPIRVLGFAADQPQILLNPPNPAVDAASRRGRQGCSKGGHVTADEPSGAVDYIRRPLMCPLPDRLTPEHVHALLSDLRASAYQRGLYRQPMDPDGQHLMISAASLAGKASPLARQLSRRLGSRRIPAATAATAGSDGTAAAGSRSSYSKAGSLCVRDGTALLSSSGSPAVQALGDVQKQQQQLQLQLQQKQLMMQNQKDHMADLVAAASPPQSPRVIVDAQGGAAAAPWLS